MMDEIIFLVEEDPEGIFLARSIWGINLYPGGDDRGVTAFRTGCGELSL